MKRGFIITVLSLFITITFGGFVMPEKGYAAVDDAQYALLQKTGDSFVSNMIPNFGIPDTKINSLKMFYLANLEEKFASNGKLTETTPNTLQTLALSAFIEDLNLLKIYFDNPQNRRPRISINIGDFSSLTRLVDKIKLIDLTITTATQKLNYTINDTNLALGNITLTQRNALNLESATNAQQSALDVISKADGKCGIFGPGSSVLACITDGFDWFIRSTVLNIGSWFLAIGSSLLDGAISYGIIHFSEWVPTAGVNDLWKLVRDVLYLCIVFIGFYLAFMYIIGKDEKLKKFIPWLIIFALFVNFSLPIFKTIIDMSNIVALNIYNSALSGGASGGTAIMSKLGLQTLLSESAKVETTVSATILAVIFVFFAAWVFFQIAIMMMVRTVVLTLCLIGSPFLLMDAMVVIPAFAEKINKVRSIFFNQLFMADVFMIMFFITLQIMKVLKDLPTTGAGSISAPNALGNVNLIFGIFMMLTLLYYMMKITKSMSGQVGEMATSWVNNGVGMLAGGVAMRGAAVLGRAAIGRSAAALRDSSWVQNNQHRFLGRKAYDLTNATANSTFDARNSGIAKRFSRTTKMDLGKGDKTGYQQNLTNTIKDRTERMQRITTLNKDGSINEEGVDAKKKFQEKVGGVVGVLTSKEDVRDALNKSNKQDQRDKEIAAVKEYSELSDDKKKAFYEKYKGDESTQQKLKEQDMAEAGAEKRERANSEDIVIANYAKEKNESKKAEISTAHKDNATIQEKMKEVDEQQKEKRDKEIAEKARKESSLEVAKEAAKSQQDMAESLKKFIDEQQSSNKKIDNFDETMTNKNSQTKININRDGTEQQTVT